MVTLQKHVIQRIALSAGMLLLVMLLTACSGIGGTGSATPTPTSAPTPTPSPTAPTVTMQTYKGATFTIDYPQGVQKGGSGDDVSFADPATQDTMTIVSIADPNGIAGASTIAQTSLASFEKSLLSNAKSATIAPTATVGGESWVQKSATGDLAAEANTPGTLVLLVDNHPANSPSTKTYEIVYYGPTATWNQANIVFQIMLQSFTFTD